MAVEIGELRGIITLSDQFSGPIDKVAKALGVTSESFKAVSQFAALGAAAIAGTTAAIVALGTRGADVADVKGAFEGLSGAVGASADVMLGKMREGTLGTITNFDLMTLANKALGAGLIKNSGDMGTLAQGAQLLADRTGGDAKEAFETLTSAIASGRTAQLKQLGLFVDTKVAVEQYANSLGKSVGDLTDSERAQALSAGTLRVLKEQLAASGGATADFGDNVQRARVHVQNFLDNLGEAIATSPVVQAGMTAMGRALDQAFGGDQQAKVKALTAGVGSFAIFLVDLATVAVKTAQFITNAFQGTKVIFNAVLEAMASGVAKVVGFMAKMAEEAGKIPGIGKPFKELGEGLRVISDFADASAVGFGEMTDKALDSAASSNAAFNAVTQGLDATRAAMVAAKDAQVELAKAPPPTGLGDALAGGAARTEEEAAKIRDAFLTLQQDLVLAQMDGNARRLAELEIAAERQIADFQALKGLTLEEYDALVAGVDEKTALLTEAMLRPFSTDIVDRATAFQQELALAQTTGIDRRLLELDFAREKEIAGIDFLKEGYSERYTELVEMINEFYWQMADAAREAHEDIAASANAAGFKTREQMEETAEKAGALYDEMVASGKFTYGQLHAAYEAWKQAEEDLDKKSLDTKKITMDVILSSASQLLTSIFGKSKTAAIAAALIDTFAAVAKALSAYPWPFNLVPAAAALAAGMAQVAKIRNTNASFAHGTPGTQFEDFGRGSMAVLHGQEAVVNRAQGESLAGLLGDAVREATGGDRAGTIAHFQLNIDGQALDRVILRRGGSGFLTLEPA